MAEKKKNLKVIKENPNKIDLKAIRADIEKQGDREEKALRKSPERIFEMHVDAIKVLADDKNEIFSEISKNDAYNIAIATLFGKNPCHNINERLAAKGINVQIKLPVLDEYTKEVFRHLHKADRKRVEEYLKALESLRSNEANVRITEDRKPTMLQRLI